MKLHTSVTPGGRFIWGVHKPSFRVRNLRRHDYPAVLGRLQDGETVDNRRNFPLQDVEVTDGDWVYEIPNPFPFRGATFISKSWGDARALDPAMIRLPEAAEVSLAGLSGEERRSFLRCLPQPLLLTLAQTSTDPEECALLAELSAEFIFDERGLPSGLRYEKAGATCRPVINNHDLFEVVVNNPHLPYAYKQVMVLRPGAQGGSEIVGEYGGPGDATHVFEYLRRNSYIPGGHYAANMADDAVRYSIQELTMADMTGLRHLYYQRTFVRLAEMVGIPVTIHRRGLCADELEELRKEVLSRVASSQPGSLPYTGILWGWNFGFDFSGSGFRLHASHQQVHQQYALVPPQVPCGSGDIPAYACGDLVADHCRWFREATGRDFFGCYLEAIRHNQRTDGDKGESSLIIHEDEHVLLFVPKAQVSQWELQIMTKREVGNILEADERCRQSLDRALLVAQKVLAGLGARLVTSIEYSKRIDNPDRDQRLLYSLLPKLPYSMGAFSEAQLRFVCSHYPEDFAVACRSQLASALQGLNG